MLGGQRMIEEEQRLEQLEKICKTMKGIDVSEQWKKPDNGPMLILLAMKDFGAAIVPILARLMQTNVDLLRENNEVHREHMKLERKLVGLSWALFMASIALIFVAIFPAVESLKHLWPIMFH